MKSNLFAALVCVIGTSQANADPIGRVAAVNAPLAYIAGVLGGSDIEVLYPVPGDIDPAYWSPSPDDIVVFQDADLILLNGAGYAGWVNTANLPRARLVDTTAAVRDDLIPAEGTGVVHKHGPDGAHEHNNDFAFTTWLDPDLARAQVTAASAALVRRWPDLSDQMKHGKTALMDEIDAMEEAFARLADRLSGRQVFASHPVYQYLERATALEIASLHWEPDAMPPDAEWSAFAERRETDRAPAMLWEDTPLDETANRLLDLGVEVIVLNPMGNTTDASELFRALGAQIP